MSSTWLLIANNREGTQNYAAKTTVKNNLLYRAVSKWIIRGSASAILSSFWQYIDQNDNELEDALLDQLLTQAETKPFDPQTTNVKARDYSIDLTVHSQSAHKNIKGCTIECTLYVYFDALKKPMEIDKQYVKVSIVRLDEDIERVIVSSEYKTPAPPKTKSKRVQKRSSKISY